MSRFGDWARRQVDKLSDALSSKKPDEQHKDSALNNMDKAREGYDAAGGTHPKFNQAALDNTREDAKYREGDEKATQYTGSMIPKKEADKSQGASDFYGEMPTGASASRSESVKPLPPTPPERRASQSFSGSEFDTSGVMRGAKPISRSNSSDDLTRSSTSKPLPATPVGTRTSQLANELDSLLNDMGAPDPKLRSQSAPAALERSQSGSISELDSSELLRPPLSRSNSQEELITPTPNKPLPPIPAPVLDDADKSRTFTKPEVQIVDKDTLPPAPSTSRAIPEDQRKMTYERDPVMTQLMESYNFEARTQAATKEIEKGPEISSSEPNAPRPPLERQNRVELPAADIAAIKEAANALAGHGDAGKKAAQPEGKEEAKGNDPTHPVVGKHTQDLASKNTSNKSVEVSGRGG